MKSVKNSNIFNVYHDSQEQFMYVQNGKQWFMSSFTEESPFVPLPLFVSSAMFEAKLREEIMLIPVTDIAQYDFGEYTQVTDCDVCDNQGFTWDGDFHVCTCYHGQVHGEESIVKHKEDCAEASALRNVDY